MKLISSFVHLMCAVTFGIFAHRAGCDLGYLCIIAYCVGVITESVFSDIIRRRSARYHDNTSNVGSGPGRNHE